jgi:hypothetical protein
MEYSIMVSSLKLITPRQIVYAESASNFTSAIIMASDDTEDHHAGKGKADNGRRILSSLQ